MNKIIILTVFILVAVFAYGCSNTKVLVGNDSDSHSCKASAGYSWCEAKQKCLRVWEENCTEQQIACTEEAKVCPDGSAVGRQGPNCEFAPCPDVEGSFCAKNGTNYNMSYADAEMAALQSNCSLEGGLKSTHFCNDYTGTWWIDMDVQKEGCSPACIVDVETKQAEINWRCTGLITKECSCPKGYVKEGEACNPECYYNNPQCMQPSIMCE